MGKLRLFHRVIDQLAKSGLILRGDPPKVIPLEGRAWGPALDGWQLSIAARDAMVSVVLRNTEATPRALTAPGWLHFFAVEITGPNGARALPTAYGRAALDPARSGTALNLQFDAGQATEVDLPIGILFQISAPGRYAVLVRCAALGVVSNVWVIEK